MILRDQSIDLVDTACLCFTVPKAIRHRSHDVVLSLRWFRSGSIFGYYREVRIIFHGVILLN